MLVSPANNLFLTERMRPWVYGSNFFCLFGLASKRAISAHATGYLHPVTWNSTAGGNASFTRHAIAYRSVSHAGHNLTNFVAQLIQRLIRLNRREFGRSIFSLKVPGRTFHTLRVRHKTIVG